MSRTSRCAARPCVPRTVPHPRISAAASCRRRRSPRRRSPACLNDQRNAPWRHAGRAAPSRPKRGTVRATFASLPFRNRARPRASTLSAHCAMTTRHVHNESAISRHFRLSIEFVRDTVHNATGRGMNILFARPRICALPAATAARVGGSRAPSSRHRPSSMASHIRSYGNIARRKV